MDMVGLSSDSLQKRAGQFSGGERQRLAIARALAVNPRLVILDEAFSGLDVATRDRIVQLLADLQARYGLAYVCISHDLELLADFASEIAVMQEGRIVTRGPSHDVLRTIAITPHGALPLHTSGAVA
jgi:ABC-type glutathione transport system ATPase component